MTEATEGAADGDAADAGQLLDMSLTKKKKKKKPKVSAPFTVLAASKLLAYSLCDNLYFEEEE